MSGNQETCENTTIIEDNIQLEIQHKNEEFNILIEGEEYNILKVNESFNVFKKLSKVEGENVLAMIKKKEEEKLRIQAEINKQEYAKKHCNEQHARAESIPCPLPRGEVVKLFESVGLTPPSPDSSICTPPTTIM